MSDFDEWYKLEKAVGGKRKYTGQPDPLPPSRNPKLAQPEGGIALDEKNGEVAHLVKASRLPILRKQYGTTTWSYKKGGARYGKFEGVGGISYEVLRLTVERSDLLQSVHSVRQFQTKRFGRFVIDPKKDIGIRIIHDRQYDPDFEINDEIKRRCAEIQKLFECPHPVYSPSFLGMELNFTEEHLAINRPVFELIKNKKGQVIQFGLIDGAALEPTYIKIKSYIRNNPTYFKGYTEDRADAEARARLSNENQIDYFDDYIYYVDGSPQASFDVSEVLICEDHKPVDLNKYGFPPSCAERAIQANLAFIQAFTYNSKYFTDGQMVDSILGLSGDFQDDTYYVVADQLRGFRGMEGAFAVPLVPLPSGVELKVTDLKRSNKEMQFHEFMQIAISLTTAKYRMHPAEINSKGEESRAGAIFERSKDRELETALDEGFFSILMLKEEAYTKIIKTIYPDLRAEYYGIDRENRNTVIDRNVKESQSYKSVNEVRVQEGLPEYDKDYFTEKGMDEHRAQIMADINNIPNNPNQVNSYMQTTTIYPDESEGMPEDQPLAGENINGNGNQNGNGKPKKKGSADRFIDQINQSILQGKNPNKIQKSLDFNEFVSIEELLTRKNGHHG